MRQPLVAGNWKMHGSRAENAQLVSGLLDQLQPGKRAEILVCPPFPYLMETARLLKDSGVALGGQSVCAEAQGAFTGEVSAVMLKDVGCQYVLVGHSERRQLYGENDNLVARKFVAAQSQGLVPVLCVGETLEEREGDQTTAVVARQLEAVLAVSGIQSLARAVIAYEPVWAIGTGRTASPEQAQAVHAMIRAKVTKRDATIGGSVRILYGGSVKASNAQELFAMPDIDGGLVGGASLKADEFARICAGAG
ncbi:MAG: triose-phosphate isomerase [Gammaproteobacteria bacterium]|nr:triose-phosphate isomerase [Gammaproteobacteria bacterium]MDH5176908.1 triose-phosphate isomerase [Gammaproteobacteria bacterium]MDH5226599.1 triose-phosphate isomerase [Gammaproteobacteria bacterium]